MRKFKDFGLTPNIQGFVGDKIKVEKIVNVLVTVLDYKIEPSKYEKGYDKCLHLQIELRGEKRVVFIGAKRLIETIEQIPRAEFPFETTIVRDNNWYEFT